MRNIFLFMLNFYIFAGQESIALTSAHELHTIKSAMELNSSF